MAVTNVEQYFDNQYRQINVEELLNSLGEKGADRLRMEINQALKIKGVALIRCGVCKEPVYLRANSLGVGGYHFCHFKSNDPVLLRCIQRAEKHTSIELIRALKYQGAHESLLHYRLKHLISALLESDGSVNPGSVKVEAALLREKEWRKPDVQAIHRQRLIAFEVQVSTEMAPMIVAREHFYERFGNILWILPKFEPERINQSQRDILTTNLDHLYVLDKKARQISRDKSQLHLKAWIHWPVLEDGKLSHIWKKQIVTLDDIMFRGGHAYVLDVAEEEAQINESIRQLELERKKKEYEQYKDWTAKEEAREAVIYDAWPSGWGDWWDRWYTLTTELTNPLYGSFFREKLKLELPWAKQSSSLVGIWLILHGIYLSQCNCTQFVIRAILCASKGKLDHGYTGWKWIAKTLLIEHPAWFSAFYQVLRVNQHGNIWRELKNDSSIVERVSEIKRLRLPPLLTRLQKKLLGLLEPKLEIDVPSFSLVSCDNQCPQFFYNPIFSYEYGEPDTVFPEDLGIVNFHLKQFGWQGGGEQENNISDVLKFMADQGYFLPFPNLPLQDSVGGFYYYVDEGGCSDILPFWDKQLAEIEKSFEALAFDPLIS